MKHFKTFLAVTMALLLAFSFTSSAFADVQGESGPPIVHHVAAERAFEGESPTAEEPSEIGVPYELNISDDLQFLSEEEIWDSVDDAVRQKVDEIVSQCRAEGITGEYDTALWLHDWLTHHAAYDKTYTIYTPDGVLLRGSGVCQSYRTAYQLLLDKAGIENTYISSNSMNHTWNLVKIDGEWCHVDVTWDDPTDGTDNVEPSVSGSERYTYFGMNDALIQLDHSWASSEAPGVQAVSLQNYYSIRVGNVCYANAQELDEQLRAKATAKANPITVQYIGTDPSVSAISDFLEWISDNGWQYGMDWTSYSYSQYSCTVQVEYGDPYQPPAVHLDPPVAAPNFTFSGPEGSFTGSSYDGSGLILIFGRTTCGNTRALLDRLYSSLPSLRENGIEVLVNLDGASTEADLNERISLWPDYRYFYGNMNTMWQYLRAAGFDTSSGVTFPCVFVVNADKMITYYSTGYVSNTERLLNEAMAVSNDKLLAELQNTEFAFIAPADLTTLEERAFENADFSSADLTTAPVSVIGKLAFADNDNLRFVRIPDSVRSIAEDAFSGCPNVIIVCSSNSEAADFARSNGLTLLCP